MKQKHTHPYKNIWYINMNKTEVCVCVCVCLIHWSERLNMQRLKHHSQTNSSVNAWFPVPTPAAVTEQRTREEAASWLTTPASCSVWEPFRWPRGWVFYKMLFVFFGVGEILAYNTKSNQHHCCQSISICIECHPVCVICKQVIKTHIRQRNDSIKRSQTWVHSTILTHTHSHTQTHTPCLPVLKSKHLWTIRIFFCFCFSSQSSGYGVCLQAVLPQSSTIFGIQQGDTDRNLAITSSSLSYSPLSLS